MGSAGPELDPVASVRPHPGLPDIQAIYGEFQPKIHRYLTRLVGAIDAEDLTQEVFIRVSQALPGFRGESSVSTWVYRIATNAALDRLRSLSSQRADRVPQQGPGEGSGIEQELIRGEMQTCIRGYVEDLPPQYRSVVLLSEGAELPNQEIAEVLGISLETVKIRLHRARSRLRKDLGRGCTFYRDGRNELACEPKSGGVSSGD